MRLICPNCDAEYEVDADAIPDAGRDVQCSNCGHSWFQARPDATAAAATVPPDPVPEAPLAVLAGEDPAPAPPPPSARLDAAALAMLKEEAARELAARRAAPPAPIEVQGDLGLPAPEAAPLPASVAASAGIAAAEAARTPPRKARLPDIEEINSTLRPQSFPPGYQADPAPSPAPPPAPGTFRTGFTLVVVLAVLAAAAYALAPQLGEAVPALAAPMAAYVALVDAGRLWLDGALRGVIDGLRSVAGPPA